MYFIKKKGDITMKKLVALLICFVLAFSLCACGKDAEKTDTANEDSQPANEENVGMPNPVTEYDSLAEVNAIVGGNLCAPGVMGVADKAFLVTDCGSYKIGEYQFTVAGYDYTLRCANVREDISGVYLSGGEGTAFSDFDTGKVVEGEEIGDNIIVYTADTPSSDDGNSNTAANGIQSNGDGEYKCARWFVDDMQYVLTVNDNSEMDHETFMSIADEIMHVTSGDI